MTDDDHRNPTRQPVPRYWVLSSASGWDAPTDWCLSLKDVTSVTNARTAISAIIPRFGAGHTLPVLFPASAGGLNYGDFAPLILANLNCTILDYLARQKVHGNHLAWYLYPWEGGAACVTRTRDPIITKRGFAVFGWFAATSPSALKYAP